MEKNEKHRYDNLKEKRNKRQNDYLEKEENKSQQTNIQQEKIRNFRLRSLWKEHLMRLSSEVNN